MNYPERGQWLPGLRISQVFGILDLVIAFGAFFGFRYILQFEVGRAMSAGFVLGLPAGVLDCLSTIVSWHPASDWIIAPLMFAGLPLTVCFLTRRVRPVWLPLLMLAMALFVMPWMSGRMELFRADHGFSFDAKVSTVWRPSIEQMVLLPLTSVAVLSIPVLLIRRFVPAFRQYEPGG